MKAYGREVGREEEEELRKPLVLREVALTGTPTQLRVVAEFLEYAADLLERHGDDFGHEHLHFWWKDWQESFADIIVVKPVESAPPNS